MAGISLSGHGLRPGHRLDHLPADGDRAEQGHGGPDAPGRRSRRTRTTCPRSRPSSTRFKTAAAALTDAATWKATQTTELVGHDQARRRAARRRRHRRPHGPDRQARLLGPARLHLHAGATAGSLDLSYGDRPDRDRATAKVTIAVAANATATDVATAINANETAPVYAAVVKDATTTSASSSPSRKTGAGLRLHASTPPAWAPAAR